MKSEQITVLPTVWVMDNETAEAIRDHFSACTGTGLLTEELEQATSNIKELNLTADQLRQIGAME